VSNYRAADTELRRRVRTLLVLLLLSIRLRTTIALLFKLISEEVIANPPATPMLMITRRTSLKRDSGAVRCTASVISTIVIVKTHKMTVNAWLPT
jgi:hypothetical protein